MRNVNNQVLLIGRLGKDVEKLDTKTGEMAKISLATNNYYTNKQGEKTEKTDWHNVIAFGEMAKNMSEKLKKGSQILIQGRISYSDYEDQQGQKRYSTQIVADAYRVMTA